MRIRIPWSIEAAAVGAGLAGIGIVAYLLASGPTVRGEAWSRLDRDLSAAATAMGQSLGPAGIEAPGLDARVKEAGRATGLRFTVIAENGDVLADSAVADPRTMEKHGERPEVVEARRAGRSVGRRRSSTVGRDLVYAAERVPGTLAVARVALDAEEAQARIDAEARFPWGAALVAILLAAGAAAVLVAPTARTVRAIASAATSIEAGDLSVRVPVRGPDMLRGTGAAFNRMVERLQADVDRVSAERARLATVLDGMDEGVVALDASERVGFVNRAAHGLLEAPAGGDPEGLEGQPLEAISRAPQVLALARAAVRRKETGEAEVVRGAPARRILHVHAAPVRGGGPGAILLLYDVSTLRRLERMRTDFVANVSHELRTPIATIAGAAETLAGGALSDPEAGPRFVDAIRRHADRLKALVDDILTLSRLESSPETIDRVPVDASAITRQACDAVAARARDAGLALDVDVADGVRVLGEPEAFRRLVDNLVVNAVTYTPSGGRVGVRLSPEAGKAVLRVTDTGIGIAAEHVERIFERFYRVDKARSRAKGGTGLGLAIVKHAVALHAGEIDVKSGPGAGSTFAVRIPLAPPARPEPEA